MKKSLNSTMANLGEVVDVPGFYFRTEAMFASAGVRPDPGFLLNDPSALQAAVNQREYPIGARRATPLGIAQAYQMLFNGGTAVPLHVVSKQTDPVTGRVVHTADKLGSQRIVKRRHARQVAKWLEAPLEPGGTAASLRKRLPKGRYMAKTGTTSDGAAHHYTVLCDGDVLVVVWVSYGKLEGNRLTFGGTDGLDRLTSAGSAGRVAAYFFKNYKASAR